MLAIRIIYSDPKEENFGNAEERNYIRKGIRGQMSFPPLPSPEAG